MTTKITPSVLENTAVTPTTYGTASQVPTVTVDAQGRITGASNTSIAIGTSQITSGTLADDRLPGQASLTAANYYGSASSIARIVTDAKGRVKSATNVAIQIATSQITGYPTFATSATTDTSNASNISTGTLSADRLATSGVTATTYGTASSVSQVTVDTKGRITGASNVAIAIASGAVSGLSASATTDTTNAANISTGTLPTARLADSGVTATTYGTASSVSRFTVDAKGRVTSASNTAISIAVGAVSGLATVATSGAYGDLSGRPTIPTIPASLPASDVYAWAKAATKPTYAYSEITSPPTIPTNTSQLNNNSGFLTSAATAVAGIGDIMGLYTKTAYATGTVGQNFHPINTEVAGSTLFYMTGGSFTNFAIGSGGGGSMGYRDSAFYSGGGFLNEDIVLYTTLNGTWLNPWEYAPAGRVVSLTGTWRALRPNKYTEYAYRDDYLYFTTCNIGLWQRIA